MLLDLAFGTIVALVSSILSFSDLSNAQYVSNRTFLSSKKLEGSFCSPFSKTPYRHIQCRIVLLALLSFFCHYHK